MKLKQRKQMMKQITTILIIFSCLSNAFSQDQFSDAHEMVNNVGFYDILRLQNSQYVNDGLYTYIYNQGGRSASNTHGAITFVTAGRKRMSILKDGEIKLFEHGDIFSMGGLSIGADADESGGEPLYFKTKNTNRLAIGSDGGLRMFDGDLGNWGNLVLNANDDGQGVEHMIFKIKGREYMRLTDGGNLRLFGSELSNWGNLVLNANDDNSVEAEHMIFKIKGREYMRLTDGGNLRLFGSELSNWGNLVLNANDDNSVEAEHMIFKIKGREYMRLTDGGNLRLFGSELSNWGNLVLNANDDNSVEAEHMIFKVRGTEYMRLADGGNFGIGTTTPNAKFVVKGNTILDSLLIGTMKLKSGRNQDPTIVSENNKWLRFGSNAGTVFFSNQNVGVDDNPTMIIKDNKIGIGTIVPSEKLDVIGTIKSERLQLTSIVSGSSLDSVVTIDASGNLKKRNAYSISMMSDIISSTGIQFPESALAQVYTIFPRRTTTNVGGSSLLVSGGQAYLSGNSAREGGNLILKGGDGYATATSTPGGVFIYGGITKNSSGDTSSHTKGNIILAHDGIRSSGNVGIGTAAPSDKLSVVGTIKTDSLVIKASTNAQLLLGGLVDATENTNSVAITSGSIGNQLLCLGSAKYPTTVQIDTSGDMFVGFDKSIALPRLIQAAKSNYSLFVKYGVLSEDFSVAPIAGWSDYVFKKDYRLMPLEEVENYITTNQHLPNIPSQSEVSKEGYSIHDMNTKLLAKIEELTLYVIEQQKQIHQQQAQLDELKTSVRRNKD